MAISKYILSSWRASRLYGWISSGNSRISRMRFTRCSVYLISFCSELILFELQSVNIL